MRSRTWMILAIVFAALWVVTAGALFLVGTVAMGALGGGDGDWEETEVIGDGSEKVVIVDVRGEIHTGRGEEGLFSTAGAGSEDVTSQLRQAAEDESVAAVILRLDTPGGSVVASDEIAKGVARVREADKPVVALMEDIAASGGMYVAAPTDHIVASPDTLTGSIGVIMVVPNFQGTAEKVGVTTQVIKSGTFKDAGSPFREMTPEERALFQRLIDEAYAQFVDVVAEGRDIDEAAVRRVADGRVLSGRQARAAGLVDEFGDLERAFDVALRMAEVSRREATLVDYEASAGLGDIITGYRSRFSPVEEVKRELGADFGLKYLFLP